MSQNTFRLQHSFITTITYNQSGHTAYHITILYASLQQYLEKQQDSFKTQTTFITSTTYTKLGKETYHLVTQYPSLTQYLLSLKSNFGQTLIMNTTWASSFKYVFNATVQYHTTMLLNSSEFFIANIKATFNVHELFPANFNFTVPVPAPEQYRGSRLIIGPGNFINVQNNPAVDFLTALLTMSVHQNILVTYVPPPAASRAVITLTVPDLKINQTITRSLLLNVTPPMFEEQLEMSMPIFGGQYQYHVTIDYYASNGILLGTSSQDGTTNVTYWLKYVWIGLVVSLIALISVALFIVKQVRDIKKRSKVALLLAATAKRR
ncbi:MAG: hypothetical protein ABSG57_07770 [Candidatus Bathyarchaeia archaeon]